MKNGLIYGGLVLDRQVGTGLGSSSGLDFPFKDLQVVDRGNHLRDFDSERESSFDFWHGHNNEAEVSKMFAPTRGISVTGYRVGETSEENLVHSLSQNLLAINSGTSEEEQQLSYAELAYSRVFSKLESTRLFVSFEISSSQSKFLLMARNVPVYVIAACSDEAMYLLWSNEVSLEERMRAYYPEKFCYFRFRPLHNSLLVIQSFFLRKKLQKWNSKLRDRLKVMNALEQHLMRRTTTEL